MFLQREIGTEIEKKQFKMPGKRKRFSLEQKIEYSETQRKWKSAFWNGEKIEKTRKILQNNQR